jgi:hypothetical protein
MDLDEHIRAVVREELARARGAAHATVYTSLALPRDVSRRTFREACRSGRVDGARREGRTWVCSREAWHAARTRARSSAPILRVVASLDDESIAARAIANAGLRRTRSA